MKVRTKKVFEFEMSEKEAKLLSNTLKKINGLLTVYSLNDDEQMIIDEVMQNIDDIID